MRAPDARLPVAVLGATGLVGQHLVRLLHEHPWFRLSEVVASPEKAGRRYAEGVDWVVGDEVPAEAAALLLGDPAASVQSHMVLSALPAEAASRAERRLAAEGHVVCSNASTHRMDPDVPLVVPEVNAHALPRGTGGGTIVTNPNCVVAGLAPVISALEGRWGVEAATVVTLQALSGGGIRGPSALNALGNVVPFIPGEEEKIGEELSRLLGRPIPLAVAVNRVPVADGHMAHLFVRLGSPADPGEVAEALREFQAGTDITGLPSLPCRPLRVCTDPRRPQPLLDIGWAGGMGVSVGRIRRVPGYDVALVLVLHNAVRGAAGACLANAELAYTKGWMETSTHPFTPTAGGP